MWFLVFCQMFARPLSVTARWCREKGGRYTHLQEGSPQNGRLASVGRMVHYQFFLGTSAHRKLSFVNLAHVACQGQTWRVEGIRYRSFLEMPQPHGRDRRGNQEPQYTKGGMRRGAICAWDVLEMANREGVGAFPQERMYLCVNPCLHL